MAIHHDKKAYGKLAPLSEDFSEDKLLKMVEKIENEKTEYEKMINGELYNAGDSELSAKRKRARQLFKEFNDTTVHQPDTRPRP